jgi:hypothetical protein
MLYAERAWALPAIDGPRFEVRGELVVPIVTVRLRNSGKSPAFMDFSASSSQQLVVPSEPDSYETGVTVAGGEWEDPKSLPHDVDLPALSQQDHADIYRKAKTLYIWVFVRYKDVIRDDRFTRACWVFYPQYNRTGPCPREYQLYR